MASNPRPVAADPIALTEPTRYRGLLVDWGGVMTTSVFDSFRAFCEQEGLDPEAVGERFRTDPESRELLIGLETGALAEDEFERRFAAILGVSPDGLIARMFAGGLPDEAMQDAVLRARAAGIRTGLISNSWGTSRYDRALLADLFDGVVISGEAGVRKPTPKIYELGARAIELQPSACVFVDDLRFNLRPAQALGMATVHHVESQPTIDELQRLLAVALR
jgi:putative hydrolase of the HAD superfamily